MSLAAEAARRRTFAIISHPDAGKTTLTEKLLLYSGAIHLAGAIKSRRAARHTVSDWMKLERERGISVTSSVLQFEYEQKVLNLLDTPGHADFSEDTYRTLAAVDSAVMLIDHAKGVEARTRKLFEVCRMRGLPIITFMNKLDHDGLDPLTLLDEVRQVLDLPVVPLNWPIGMGREFRGVVDLATRQVSLFQGVEHGASQAEMRQISLAEAGEVLPADIMERLLEELELLDIAGDAYTDTQFLQGQVSPVFWGSAMTNFGIMPLLDFLAEKASAPRPQRTDGAEGRLIQPEDEAFSAVIFKIQANMDPRHRDRIAFMRVISGEFKRGMEVKIARTGQVLRLSKPHSFIAQERSIVEHAWPGDIVGLYDPGKLHIGDTLSTLSGVNFSGIPRFAPAFFGRFLLRDPLKRKALDTGLEHLAHEGVIQLFYPCSGGRQDVTLGAVGMLQFEVLKERLAAEYSVKAIFEPLSYKFSRWVGGSDEGLAWLKERNDFVLCKDRHDRFVLLCQTQWPLNYALEHAPGLELFDVEPL